METSRLCHYWPFHLHMLTIVLVDTDEISQVWLLIYQVQ